MNQTIILQLEKYYQDQGIHPENFKCRNQTFCQQFAHQGKMTETKMSLVGSRYGEKYPRIVVLSLDPPLGEESPFKTPEQRTTAYVTAFTEAENYTRYRPNVHWAMTQIMVKDVLCLFGYEPVENAAVVLESYGNRAIENVSPYFAHVNVSKCSMNNPGKGQAEQSVQSVCSNAYLSTELTILQPHILISQGKSANQILGGLLGKAGISNHLPQAVKVQIGSSSTLWLPMDHPARHLSAIRQRWLFYAQAIRAWASAG